MARGQAAYSHILSQGHSQDFYSTEAEVIKVVHQARKVIDHTPFALKPRLLGVFRFIHYQRTNAVFNI
jgi:hypothetical protein